MSMRPSIPEPIRMSEMPSSLGVLPRPRGTSKPSDSARAAFPGKAGSLRIL